MELLLTSRRSRLVSGLPLVAVDILLLATCWKPMVALSETNGLTAAPEAIKIVREVRAESLSLSREKVQVG